MRPCALLILLTFLLVSPLAARAPTTAKIAFTSTRDNNSEIYIMNPDGSQQVNLSKHTARDLAPAWSPTGEQIAFNSNRGGVRDIYLMDADGKNVRRVFRHSAYREYPTWSPDGQKLAYLHAEDWSIYVGTVDGKQETRVAWTNFLGGWPDWSPDGTEIAFIYTAGPGGYLLKAVNLQTGKERIIVPNNGPQTLWNPDWSPDGTRIAFQWYQKGIYVVDANGENLKRLIPNASRPAWSPRGDELIYGKKQQLFKFNVSSGRSTQLTRGAINFGADWFDPQLLPVQPRTSFLTTTWSTLKQR